MFAPMFASGTPFMAFLASNDLTTPVALTLRDADGNAITLRQGDRVRVTDVVFNNGGTASVITLFQDHDGDGALDAGEEVYAASLAANSANIAALTMPLLFRPVNAAGTNVPMVVASAISANTRIAILGVVTRG